MVHASVRVSDHWSWGKLTPAQPGTMTEIIYNDEKAGNEIAEISGVSSAFLSRFMKQLEVKLVA